MHFLRSLFKVSDETFSHELVRNEIARMKLSKERLDRKAEEERFEMEIKDIDDSVRKRGEQLASEAKPLLDDFNDISLAQHYYQEIGSTVASQLHLVSQRSEREFAEFGYVSKKLISVGLNYEALKNKMKAGLPFSKELTAVLNDADSEDISLVAAPLRHVESVPSPAVVRSAAFNLGRAIVETSTAPSTEQVSSLFDFFKFRTLLSPAMFVARRLDAQKTEAKLLRYIERGEYHWALSLAEDVYADVTRGGVKDIALLDDTFSKFRSVVLPAIAADMFLRYSASSLCASRFACVENMLKE